MKRLAIMAGLAAVAFSGAFVSDSVLTGSFAKITTYSEDPVGRPKLRTLPAGHLAVITCDRI